MFYNQPRNEKFLMQGNVLKSKTNKYARARPGKRYIPIEDPNFT